MIRITQIKMEPGHAEAALRKKAAALLRLPPSAIAELTIRKQSIDARKKPALLLVYEVFVKMKPPYDRQEADLVKRLRKKEITIADIRPYRFPEPGTQPLSGPPLIIGTGPAGLFCGLILARAGYRPVLIERGAAVEERLKDVEAFWSSGTLKADSNVQFGEGGAGAFSDGKLNTLVKDVSGRNRKVLELLAEAGAPEEILWQNKPHIGTDLLRRAVKNIREEILRLGGQVLFHCKASDLIVQDGRVCGIVLEDGKTIEAGAVVLAVGHSARDTFEMLHRHQISMHSKAFAVGLRIEHPQDMVTLAQYGSTELPGLPAADYKLTHTCGNGRGVYTFCMCPGGYVVNASSEAGRLATNGMSYHARDGKNANSAVIVTVTPEDFGGTGPLSGMEFQRRLEEAAYRAGNGKIPVQLFGDFCLDRISSGLGRIIPAIKGTWQFGDLRSILPPEAAVSLEEGIRAFGKKIKGFDRPDAVLSGIESRTSSPVRIDRDDRLESSLKGLYPCGEGAGYAGGITSAAMDGMKVAEEIISRYARPGFDESDEIV
ncbi:NAD(P)/FAD-dependent oxidoreductase [Cuneatibacter caecimuris]|uniref:Uncharacterized protein n=1 Tax=Cuneatibacter caecimuris TaxID=1796618 RepID=A0A4Q7P2R9_9FIRM|nr:FAD-dependent oxidoreductase [Cuneatibacter caecimuris]RZS92952.1 hypothetical protein EV209_2697 [Cuneatibacter caecimuris]